MQLYWKMMQEAGNTYSSSPTKTKLDIYAIKLGTKNATTLETLTQTR